MLSGPSKAQTLASDPRGQALEPPKWLVHVGSSPRKDFLGFQDSLPKCGPRTSSISPPWELAECRSKAPPPTCWPRSCFSTISRSDRCAHQRLIGCWEGQWREESYGSGHWGLQDSRLGPVESSSLGGVRFKRFLKKKYLAHGEGSCHMVLVGKT